MHIKIIYPSEIPGQKFLEDQIQQWLTGKWGFNERIAGFEIFIHCGAKWRIAPRVDPEMELKGTPCFTEVLSTSRMSPYGHKQP